ncbi:MAG: catechol 1,2-dioxygenase [Betaproteobacteria bacterium]|nr:catechol 1,2-dioxygenase [Betaproteobacteria bacterium]
MIIENQLDITPAVLAELERAQDPRFREIMGAAVRHLHAFVREVKLTEPEFQLACATIAKLGHSTTPSHNEVVLAAGSLGISSLVCLLNNGDHGQTETTANLLGPFWREGVDVMPNGASIVRSTTPGVPLFVNAWVKDCDGKPVDGAVVDVWQSSSEGFYENQDPAQADMNLRGKFITDAAGHVSFRSIKPAGYPIPVNGPVGDLLRAQGRHNLRPAHIHFMVVKPGYKTQFSQVYSSDDPNLDTDVQFAVTKKLVGQYVQHENVTAPSGDVSGPWYSLDYTFTIEAGPSKLPRAPITGKASGPRPTLEILKRT